MSEATNDDETMNGDTIVDFIKGMVRASLVKEAGEQSTQKIRAKDVAFAVRGTEYEISYDGEGVELDVIEGEVEVSSPEVNTFAPEVVKANEGLRFSRKEKGFKRRKFASRFKDHPGFLKREEVRARFKKIREMRKTRRAQNRDARIEKRHDRKEARKHRREERRKNKK